MKKYIYLLIIGLIVMALSACGGGNEESSSGNNEAKNEKNEDKDNDESISVEKNLLSVEITLPASFVDLQGEDIDQVIAEAKSEGIEEVTLNDDGSLTYKMSKATHKEMMEEMESSLISTIDDIKTSEDFVSIEDVTYNKSFSEFTMIVDREAFENSFDAFATMSLGMSGMFYQMFDGVNTEDNKVTIHLEDVNTGEVFDTIVYPDAMEEEESN